MKYIVTHTTTYTYFEPVSLCHNIVKLLPRNTGNQLCNSASIRIHPKPDVMDEYDDFLGNKVVYFSIEKEHRELTVTVVSEIEKKTLELPGIDADSTIVLEEIKQELNEFKPGLPAIRQFVFETGMTAWSQDIMEYALQSYKPGRPVLEATEELMHRIYTDFEFKPGFTTIATPLSVVMQQRKGVCQDFAHLAIACARSAGLAARYVSGYIETVSPEGLEKLVGVDASHAWFSVYIPGRGWVDFDPTNNMIPSDQHITIGWGRDYSDITPVRGVVLSSGAHELVVSVDVRRN